MATGGKKVIAMIGTQVPESINMYSANRRRER